MRGSVSSDGSVNVAIELDSVNTLIEVRNERVREMLFETVNFPLAKITAKVEAALFQKVIDGGKAVGIVTLYDMVMHYMHQ